MDRGFMPLNAIMFGITDTLRKSKNLSPFTVSVVRSLCSAIIPVEMALALLPFVNSWCYSFHIENIHNFELHPLLLNQFINLHRQTYHVDIRMSEP